MTVEMLRAFFGWCTLLNWALMLISFMFIALGRSWIFRMHAKMFGIAEEDVSKALYLLMAGYKIAIFVFCVVPYIVLRIIA
jgi:hypothetical protein